MSELLVMSMLAGRRCALRAGDVGSVIEAGTIAPVPRAPAHVIGITALRSQAMTVIDCRIAIGKEPSQFPCDSHLAIVEVEGHSYALRLDQIDDIGIAQSDLAPIPGGSGDDWNRVSHGMIETDRGPVLLLNVAQLIAGTQENLEVAA